MTETEITAKFEQVFARRGQPDYIPSLADWKEFQSAVEWEATETFRALMMVAPLFYFEGGLLRIASSEGIQGEDTILSCLLVEREIGGWNDNWMPFYDF